MKKQAQTILANVRRGFSSIASSPVASSFKHVWKEQNKFVLGFVFMGGWFAQSIISIRFFEFMYVWISNILVTMSYSSFQWMDVSDAYKRREHWLRVHKFLEDEEKRIRGEIYLKRDKVIKVLFKLSVFIFLIWYACVCLMFGETRSRLCFIPWLGCVIITVLYFRERRRMIDV